MSNSSEWDPPPLMARVRNPRIGREWIDRCNQWAAANPEIARAWDDANLEAQERRWRYEQRVLAVNRVRASGISQRAVYAFQDGLQETPATQAVATFVESGKTFLLLMGSAGSGKTLATTLALSRKTGLFIRALELARLSVYERNDRERLEQAQGARVLVLDDLGAENLHDGWRPVLDELIDIRWGSRRQTIITTNLDATAFKARYGIRIADRIRDDGFIEKCGDKSRRGQS